MASRWISATSLNEKRTQKGKGVDLESALICSLGDSVQALGEVTGGFTSEAEIFGVSVRIEYSAFDKIDPIARLKALLTLAGEISRNTDVSDKIVMRGLMEIDSWIFSGNTLKSPGWLFPEALEVEIDADKMEASGLGWLYEIAKIQDWRKS